MLNDRKLMRPTFCWAFHLLIFFFDAKHRVSSTLYVLYFLKIILEIQIFCN